MATQACPNCQLNHDTKVYVSGQKILCRCGIRFEVKRSDVSMVGRRVANASSVRAGEVGVALNVSGPLGVEGGVAPNSLEERNTAVGGGHLRLATPAPVGNGGGVTPVPVETPMAAVPAPEEPRAAPAGDHARTALPPYRRAEEPAAASEAFAATALRPATPPAPAAHSDNAVTRVRPPDNRPELPGYQLLEMIGRGGMGEVWRAKQISLDRVVAVKLLPESLAGDREFIARFDKEATALAAMSHPNIIQIIDRGVVGSHYYFVMEFVSGRSLRELMSQGPMAPQEALRLIGQICSAIDYAHDRGIIHRDLKPENILIDERGHVKVADFGLAGFVGHDAQKGNLTATSVAMGTINYMAPEQRRDAKSVDGRADLYSLGVILYELLTGELPLGRFKLPSERGPVDVRLDRIIIRALETDPDARYARASHIGAEVEALISGAAGVAPLPAGNAPVVHAPTSIVQKGWSGVRYGLTFIGALTLVALVVRGPLDRLFPGDRHAGGTAQASQKRAFPANTNEQVFTAVTTAQSKGTFSLESSFDPAPADGAQAFNANDGTWTVEGGRLIAVQAGDDATKGRLRPRAYLSRRYFSSDDFSAEVQMRYRSLSGQYSIREDAQIFEELSFRFANSVTVSVFAIPGKGVRLLWAYNTVDGLEVVGNSAQDPNSLIDDEVPPPPEGEPFTVRLSLKRQKDGTLAEAFVNGDRVGRKLLVGLQDTTGKLAVGCRNLRCEFDDLRIRARAVPRPKKSAAGE